MVCTSCGTTNRDDAQFCRGCGTAIQRIGQPSSITEAPTAPLPPPPPPVAEQNYQSPLSEQHNYPPNYTAYMSQTAPAQNPLSNPSYANYQPPLPASASGRAVASLILSILSIVTCFPLLSIPGMILGKMEMNAIQAGQASPAGSGMAKAGFWIGLIMTILSCGGGVLWLLGVSLSILGGAMSG